MFCMDKQIISGSLSLTYRSWIVMVVWTQKCIGIGRLRFLHWSCIDAFCLKIVLITLHSYHT